MSKHFVAVLEGIPHCYHGGGGITAYAVVQAMHEAGHQVSIIVLQSSPFSGGKTEAEHIAHLDSLGIQTIVIKPPKTITAINRTHRYWNYLTAQRLGLFTGFQQTEEVARLLKQWQPDAIFMYHWNALAATYKIRLVPKFGAVGDPAHLPQLFRRKILSNYNKGDISLFSPIKQIKDKISTICLIKLMKLMLLDCDARGAFAAHHSRMFQQMGVNPCLYLHTPVPDPLRSKKKLQRAEKFKVLHIGHLQGTATLSGVELLANEILPILSRSLPKDDFEVHVVGGFFDTIPEPLKQKLTHPCVKIRGQISPPDEEFLSSHIVLVPTPIELGIRVRIISAFSYGSCVVAHQANQMGIPEMEHKKNCLMGRVGAELAKLCLEIYKQTKLRKKLEKNARKTYEEFFSIKSAGTAICRIMQQISEKSG